MPLNRIEHAGRCLVIAGRRLSVAGLALLVSTSFTLPARSAESQSHPSPRGSLSPGYRFAEASGEQLFVSVCQGCHMPDGNGAAGAGNYPALAGDKNLEASGYPVDVVVRGQRAMPPVGSMMSDDQVAAVVNYVRTHFGNQYQDAVRAEDVGRARP